MNQIQYLLELHSAILCIAAFLFYYFAFRKKDKGTNMLAAIILVNAFVLLCDMAAYAQQGRTGSFAVAMHWISNFFLYSLEYIETIFLAYYICYILSMYAKVEYRWLPRLATWGSGLLFALLASNYYTGCYYYFDEMNYYHRGPLLAVNMGFQLLLVCIGFCLVLRHWKLLPRRTFRAMLCYFIFPIVGIVLQMLFFGFSFFNIATSVSVVAFLWVRIGEINEESRRQEEILSQTRICLLNAQMNPHFIFNALSVIDYLMSEDVDLAHSALMEFSKYLRTTIEMDPREKLVTLEKEIEFAKAYAYIEELRFGDNLAVDFDIEDPAVKLPFLTIEPLVENAIKHGIRRRNGKGRVLVRSRKVDHQIVITVADDGCGFNTEVLSEPQKSSRVGLANVRERIQLLTKGTVDIESEVGKGTCVTICIPEVTV